MDNEDAIVAGEEFARAHEDALAADAAEEGLIGEDSFELEIDEQVHVLPGALKGALLRQADYTRKTQELAEHRRALEAERQALAQAAAARRGAGRDELRLAELDEQLDACAGVDWDAYVAADPEGAAAAWSGYQRLAQARDELAYAVDHRRERQALQTARDAAEAMAATGAKLREEIEGWSPEVAAKLVDYAQAFGVTMEELAQAADPRLWKLLHKAYVADQASQGAAQVEAQGVRPAVVVGAAAAAGGVRDELSTKEWMRRRSEQVARGR